MIPACERRVEIVTITRFHSVKSLVTAIQSTYGHAISRSKQLLPEKASGHHQVVLKDRFLAQTRVIGHFGGDSITLGLTKQSSLSHGRKNLIDSHRFHDSQNLIQILSLQLRR